MLPRVEAIIVSAVILFDLLLLYAIAKTWRPRAAVLGGALLMLSVADLGYFNVQCFRLEAPAEMTIPAELLRKDPPIRFVEASGYPHLDYSTLRDSRFVGAAVVNHRSAVGTDDGGVLPGATARLYRAIAANAPSALAAAACDYAWAPSRGAWSEIENALPRVRFVPDAHAALLKRPIEEIGPAEVKNLRAARSADIRLSASAPTRLEISVDAREYGWLVIADTLYSGCRCSVDGAPAVIEPAHGVFRRVRVAPGRHDVTMKYEPRSAVVGALGTLAGIILAASLLTAGRISRRRCTDATTAKAGGAS